MDDIADMNNAELEEALKGARADEQGMLAALDDLYEDGVSVDSNIYMDTEMALVDCEQRVAYILQEMRHRAADLEAARDEGTFRQGFLNKLRSMRP
jgi:hypothetical protein